MDIAADDVKRLAKLSMLEVEASEAERLSSEMNAILLFFSSVKDFAAHRPASQAGQPPREDGSCCSDAVERDAIVSCFPSGEGRNLNVPRGL